MAGLTLKAHTLGVALGETIQFSGDANADGLMGLAQGVRTPCSIRDMLD